jgi:hypothetical protein
MACPNFRVMPIPEAMQLLKEWIAPQLPEKYVHANEKMSDAELIALAVLRILHKVPYFSRWWLMVKIHFFRYLPSLTQAWVRLKRLTPIIEKLAVQVETLTLVIIDSQPLPVCRLQRATRCKVPEASLGYGTQGGVYGFKLHVWTKLNGQISQYLIRPANLHDLTVGYELNQQWLIYGAPKIIGDKAYQDGVYLTPPKKNAISPDPRWKDEFTPARTIIESTFSSLVSAGIRFAQVKSLISLRLRVALTVLAHNLPFVYPSTRLTIEGA